MKTIKCGIVEDVPFARNELKRALEGLESGDVRFKVAFCVSDGHAAFDELEGLNGELDVLLIDFELDARDHDGASVAERYATEIPSLRVCFVTDHYRHPDNLKRMLAVPESSIVAKSDDSLVTRLAGIAAGRKYISSAVIAEMQRHYLGGTVQAPKLTDRELDVLCCMAVGLTDQGAASLLHISPGTVRSVVTILSAKLMCPSKQGAIVNAAWECGVLSEHVLEPFRTTHSSSLEHLIA